MSVCLCLSKVLKKYSSELQADFKSEPKILRLVFTKVECLGQTPAPAWATEYSEGVVSFPGYPAIFRCSWQT